MEWYNTTDRMSTTSGSSSVVSVNSSSSTDDVVSLDLVAALWIFGAPVIFVVGICGNALVLAASSSYDFTIDV